MSLPHVVTLAHDCFLYIPHFYSWYFDVVKDCGCFGDALHLTPFQSFMKDIVLFILIFSSLSNERNQTNSWGKSFDIPCLYRFYRVFFILLVLLLASTREGFQTLCNRKKYSCGNAIASNAITDSVVMLFLYEKDGKQLELTMDQLKEIDSTYKFIDRKDKVIREGDKPPIHDFTITSTDGTDVTADVLQMENVFLLVAYDINKSDKSVQGQVNDFVSLCQKAGVEFIGLTSSAPKEVESFRHEHNSGFEYYFTDGTTLKTMIRSNPGLMLLKKGKVEGMWHYNDFPTFDEVKSHYLK
ncbi:MAG: hypothetical protein IPG90_09885 [Bacteroidetes bacterium]|nr:hypothetical protein [Bacteroidota bacterium]